MSGLPGWGTAPKPAAGTPNPQPGQPPVAGPTPGASPPAASGATPATSAGPGQPAAGALSPEEASLILQSAHPMAGPHNMLLGGSTPPVDWTGSNPPAASPPDVAADDGGTRLVAIELIEHSPFQPRQDFDPAEIQQLAESIATHGLLQPVVVRRVHDHYQLVAGERRLRAAGRAGWIDVPVRVVEADDRQATELAIIENLQRKDLNALEKAASFQRYLEQYGCTQEELASRLMLDRSTIANLIRLLELPGPVQEAVRQGRITPGHARALLPLGEERLQIEFCERTEKEGLNVRQIEGIVQSAIAAMDQGPLDAGGREGAKARVRRAKNDHVAALEQEFRAALGIRVKITHNAKGRGKLVIPFGSHEEFERLRGHICGPTQPLPQAEAGSPP
ncbi:MAG: ParB/RepB/Spo0J family partition protein [Thermoguttaceae bacterium]